MKYLDEFRDGPQARRLIDEISRISTQSWAIMEVCGGQTHSIIRNGIDQVLPSGINLIHGPGCPVCVTPLSVIDKALYLAAQAEVIFCSFGDMLRVPGSNTDLQRVKAAGGDVRVVYSPLDAVKIARANKDRQVVFFAIGFETTAPANAMAIKLAKEQGIDNFSALVSHVLVPPAIKAILNSPDNRVQAFLAAGHVCSVMGYHQYHEISKNHEVPIVVTGFEPLDLLEGLRRAILLLESDKATVENAYQRVVTESGNTAAQKVISDVFEVTDRAWRGIGIIPSSGWKLKPAFSDLDAEHRFSLSPIQTCEPSICRSGEVLQGSIKPHQCAAFGRQCTPRHPLGATMVSTEGACAAYFNYGRFIATEGTP
jgi:hydrogenase expression/formation protein HypD